ncbi:hypothetical protein B7463_g3296, partial [Scytalidium lignicola]
MYFSVAPLLAIAAVANAAIIDISVGATGLVYTPDSVTANVGDVLRFRFFSTHNVAQGDFSNPCQPAASNPFYSGFITGNSTGENIYLLEVTTTDPIWYYCSVGKHCPAGMVGVINPPADLTVDDYKDAAKNATVVSPATVQGGTVTTIGTECSASTSTTTGTASPTHACNHDNCLRAVIASAFPTRSGSADCSSFFVEPSVIPARIKSSTSTLATAQHCLSYLQSTSPSLLLALIDQNPSSSSKSITLFITATMSTGPNPHEPLITSLTTPYNLLVSLRYIPPDATIHPPLGGHTNVDTKAAHEAGFDDDTITVMRLLPYLSEDVGDHLIANETWPRSYINTDSMRASRNPAFADDELPSYALTLTSTNINGYALIYNVRTYCGRGSDDHRAYFDAAREVYIIERSLKDIYIDCGWDVDAGEGEWTKNFRGEEFEGRMARWFEEVLKPAEQSFHEAFPWHG